MKRKTRFNGLILCTVGVLLFNEGCRRQSEYDNIIFERCTVENPLRKVIDFMPFGDFKPGICFDAARLKFGEPKRVWTGANQITYHLYPGMHGDVAIAHEIQLSGGISEALPRLTYWTVYAYPPMGKPTFDFSLLLDKNIREKVEEHKKPCVLILHGEMNEDIVHCYISEVGISKIRWVSGSSRGRGE
jgi:hypothetical protein